MTTTGDAASAFADTSPVATPPRITGLDVTRGFAVMGILAMNIVAFAMPEAAYITPRAWGGDTGPDLWVWAFNYVLLDSKMRGLFSMMFGASTLLVMQSAMASGRNPAQTHYARMAVLALFGLAHFYLIWFGDILFMYAMMGMLLWFFRNLSVKALSGWGIGLIALNALPFILGMGFFSFIAAYGGPPGAVKAYGDFAAQFAPRSDFSMEQFALFRSDWATIVAHNFDDDLSTPFFGLVQFGAETLGLMLIGMALYKSGLLRGEWSLDRLDKWRNVGLGIGIVGGLSLLAFQFATDLEPATVLGATLGFSVPFDVTMSIGYAALFMGLAQRFASAPLIGRVAATGRAAFTNYLGTSLLMTFIFYGWGLGQFGSWSRIEVYGPVLVAWTIMLLWSKPWLDHFLYGPLEWVWRSLSRGAVQPLRRR